MTVLDLTPTDLDGADLEWREHQISGSEKPARMVLLHADAERQTRTVMVEFPPGWKRDAVGHQPAGEEMVILVRRAQHQRRDGRRRRLPGRRAARDPLGHLGPGRHPRPGLVLRSRWRLDRRPLRHRRHPGCRAPGCRGRSAARPSELVGHGHRPRRADRADLRHRRRPAVARGAHLGPRPGRRARADGRAGGSSYGTGEPGPTRDPGRVSPRARRASSSYQRVVRFSTTRVTNSGGSSTSIASRSEPTVSEVMPTSSGPAAPPRVIRNCSSAKPRPRRLAGTTSAEAAVRLGIAPAKPTQQTAIRVSRTGKAGEQHDAGQRHRAQHQEAECRAQPPGRLHAVPAVADPAAEDDADHDAGATDAAGQTGGRVVVQALGALEQRGQPVEEPTQAEVEQRQAGDDAAERLDLEQLARLAQHRAAVGEGRVRWGRRWPPRRRRGAGRCGRRGHAAAPAR